MNAGCRLREDSPKARVFDSVYRLDDLSIYPGSQQVFRGDDEISLPRLSFDLLTALVRAAPNTVSQEELLAQVWPGLVVSPETVTQRVKLLRDALGDDSRAPRYIGLVRGRGYRLLVPVESEPAASLPASAAGRRWLPPLALGALLLLVGAWFFAAHRDGAPRAPGAPPAEPSIAVLPFASLAAETGDLHNFATGIHDELLTRLAQIGGLRVISRGSVLEYRDSRKSMREIGQELGVATLLEGSVQRVGDRVRINVQLIDADTDAHLWAQAFDRELSVSDLLDIQADIARTIAGELQVELQPQLLEAMKAPATTNLEAYRLYLAANEYRYRFLEESDRELLVVAEDHYRRAIGLDPSFALAHAGLGRVLAEIYWQRGRLRSPALLGQARDAAERALQLAPGLAEAHIALALYEYYGFRRYHEALAEIEVAERLMPGNADVYFVKATILRRLGRLDPYAAATERLFQLAPLGRTEGSMAAGLRLRQGRVEDARAVYRQMLERVHGTITATAGLAGIDYLVTGDLSEYRALAALDLQDDPYRAWQVAWAAGDVELARAALDAMSRDDSLGGDLPPFGLLRGLTELRAGHPEAGGAELTRLRGALEKALSEPDLHDTHNYYMTLALVQAALGEHAAAIAAGRQAVEALPLEKDRFQGARLLVELAMVYAQAGKTEAALDALEQGLREPFAPLPLNWQPDPRLYSVRGHPRFAALVDRYGAGGARWRQEKGDGGN